MRTFLNTLILVTACGGPLLAQTPTAGAPATPAAPVARAPRAAAPSTVTIQVADSSGLPLANAQVTVQGALSRDGVTAADGSIRFANMRAGNYRLRFTREGSITLERDIVVRAGEPLLVDVALSAAPPPPPPPAPVRPEPPPDATKPLGPPADPKLTAIPTFLEKNFIGSREGRKDSSLGCTSTAEAVLHQLRDAWLSHTHDDADEWLYVVAGEGTLKLGTSEQRIAAGTLTLIPHTVAHAILPGGKNPLVVFSILTGKPCTP